MYPTIASFTVILNTVEIVLICKKWKILKTYEQLLLSLAISDVIAGFIVLLFGLIDVFVFHVPDLGQNIFLRVLLISFTFSLANLLLISLDRMAAVRFPLKHKTWMTGGKMTKIIIVIWAVIIVAMTIEISLAYKTFQNDNPLMEHFYHAQFPWMILASVAIFVHIYVYIVVTVTRQTWKSDKNRNPAVETTQRHMHMQMFKRQQPVIITCLLVVICYVVCTSPFAIELLVIKKDSYYLGILFFASTVIDPLIYFFKGSLERKYNGRNFRSSSEDHMTKL